ncbi:MAG: hypothetical protein J7639_13020, partial [Paenibacillaceae bacterium]|nr:hypothetical protein [Paenibacillaceae bacterium]
MNGFLTRTIVSYCIFAVLLIGVVGIFLINKSNHLLTDEVSMESRYRVDNIRDYVEQLLQKYEYASLSKVMPTVNAGDTNKLRTDEDLLTFVDRPVEDDIYQVFRISNFLRTFTFYNQGVGNVTLAYKDRDFSIDSNYFYLDYRESADGAFIAQLPQTEPYTWLLRNAADGQRMLTYVYTLPYMAKGDQVKGYFYLDIDMDQLNAAIRSLLNPMTEELYVYAPDGALIAQSAGDRSLSADAKKPFIVSETRSVRSGTPWTFELHRTINSYSLIASQLKREVTNICLIVLLVGLLSSVCWSLGTYGPVKRMSKKLHKLTGELREKQISHILYGSMSGMIELPLPTEARYVAAVIEVEEGTGEAFKRRFAAASHALEYEMVGIKPDEIMLLYRLDNDRMSVRSIREELEAFRAVAGEAFPFRAGIGSVASAIEGVSASLRQAQRALSFVFLFGHRVVVVAIAEAERG